MLPEYIHTDVTNRIKLFLCSIRPDLDTKIIQVSRNFYPQKNIEILHFCVNIADRSLAQRTELEILVRDLLLVKEVREMLDQVFTVPESQHVYVFATDGPILRPDAANIIEFVGKFGIIYIPHKNLYRYTYICPFCKYIGFKLEDNKIYMDQPLSFSYEQDVVATEHGIIGVEQQIPELQEEPASKLHIRVSGRIICLNCNRDYTPYQTHPIEISIEDILQKFHVLDKMLKESIFFDAKNT